LTRRPLVGDREDRCARRSEAAVEPLAGTASTIRRWLLVEHPGPWGRDGLLDARLPDGLGERLRELERRTGARVLLVRRPSRSTGATTTCFAVDTADGWIGRATLDAIEDVPELHPADRDAFPETAGAPVAVVCTHGRRDPCCAERGRPLAAAAAARFADAVWESTHVGGDRFAGNLIIFPEGLMFGRVAPTRGAEVIEAYTRGSIALDEYRGRTSEPMPVQAAEAAVRTRLGLDGIDDVRPVSYERDRARATVRLALPRGQAQVALEREELAPMRLTCAAADEQRPSTWVTRSLEIDD
jgi:hypothetical protein